MKKILFIMHHAESVVWFKNELIEKLIVMHYEVHIAVPNYSSIIQRMSHQIIFHETYINRRGLNPYQDYILMKKYCNIIKTIKPNIILTTAIKPNIYGNLAAIKNNIPVISNVTGVGSTFQNTNSIVFKIVCMLYKKAFKKTSRVFFENQYNADLFIKFKLIQPSQLIVVSGSGVNLDKFYPRNYQKEKKEIRFLLIGRIMEDKGIKEYLEATKMLSKEYPYIKFKIMGMIEDYHLFDRIKRLDYIEYLGQLEDPREEICKSDCIVLPSYHEGMANTLLEGAAMEKPLIASNINGCKEIVEDGVTGFLCEVKNVDSLVSVMKKIISLTEEERIQMGQRGRIKMLQEFNRENVVNKYIFEIERVLGI